MTQSRTRRTSAPPADAVDGQPPLDTTPAEDTTDTTPEETPEAPAEVEAPTDPRIGDTVAVGSETVSFPDGTEYDVDPATGTITGRRN